MKRLNRTQKKLKEKKQRKDDCNHKIVKGWIVLLDDIIRRIKSNKRGKETETSANTKWSGVNSIRTDKEWRKKKNTNVQIKVKEREKGDENQFHLVEAIKSSLNVVLFFLLMNRKKLYTPSNVVVSGCVYTSGTIEWR